MRSAVYDVTGTILWICVTSLEGELSPVDESKGLYTIEVGDGVTELTHYIFGGEPELKLANPTTLDTTSIAVGTGIATFSNIPTGATVCIAGECIEILDGALEYSSDLPETQAVEFSHPTYLFKNFEVTTV